MPSVQMGNYGLLSGLAKGLEAGMDGYMAAKKMQRDDNQQKMLMMQNGLIQNDDGSVDFSAEEKMKRANALKTAEEKRQLDFVKEQVDARAKGLILNKGEDGYSLEKDPAYVDYEKLLRGMQIEKLRRDLSDEKKYTEAENTAAGFAQRVQDSDSQIKGLLDKGYDPSSLKNVAQRSKLFPEMFKGEDSKLMNQAERNFINAVLRKESGASISPTEFKSAEKQYFAREGDTKEVVAQKARNREVALAGLKTSAGGAFGRIAQNLGGSHEEKKEGSGLLKTAGANDKSAKLKRLQELRAKRDGK